MKLTDGDDACINEMRSLLWGICEGDGRACELRNVKEGAPKDSTKPSQDSLTRNYARTWSTAGLS